MEFTLSISIQLMRMPQKDPVYKPAASTQSMTKIL